MVEKISAMKSRYFITGTDTGVGKTLVTAALMLAAQSRGIRAAPVKPVQTGCSELTDDLAWCLSFSPSKFSSHEQAGLSRYRYPLAASPHLAAAQAGERISVAVVSKFIEALSRVWDVLIIEGAGGLLTPLNEEGTMLDALRSSRAGPVLVVRSSLGTLNHTDLTLREMKRADCPPVAVVINETQATIDGAGKIIRDDNIERITAMVRPAPTVFFPHHHPITPAALLELGLSLANALSLPPNTR
jgi:dethiobiotin synthetase